MALRKFRYYSLSGRSWIGSPGIADAARQPEGPRFFPGICWSYFPSLVFFFFFPSGSFLPHYERMEGTTLGIISLPRGDRARVLTLRYKMFLSPFIKNGRSFSQFLQQTVPSDLSGLTWAIWLLSSCWEGNFLAFSLSDGT